ncbi:hypothetical protein FVE85_5781 [Porphyridium purpureum]|uniref:Uncharacterized protein n=1 Tax=Porphyridium purpureum TaxID=35688 RepID=A0A5J4Z3K5_PORPP|nr:hypothetical protein FVE85_5781 [Porphyridium purpureum]|eukprot:POR9544..scf295_1
MSRRSTWWPVVSALAVLAVLALWPGAAAQSVPIGGGVIYGAERDLTEKNFYTISTGEDVPSITLLANMTQRAMEDEDFPTQCFGYMNPDMTGGFNDFTPNALAFDGSFRLFFAAWDITVDPSQIRSRLCFFSLFSDRFFFVQLFPDLLVGATFDQTTYNYIYIREGAPRPNGFLELVSVSLDRTTARVISMMTESTFVDATGGTLQAPGQVFKTYRGGDMAVDCNGVLFASSVGTGGGNKMFFSIGLRNTSEPGSQNVFRLIHEDPAANNGLTGFADSDQLAFDQLGRLISQDSERGIFSVVNEVTGANGELGVEGVDFVRFFDNGQLRTFSDLASFLDCGVVVQCVEVEVIDQCDEERMVTVLEPQDGGDVPCRSVQGQCRMPPECTDEVDCVYFIRAQTQQMPDDAFGLQRIFGA